MFSETNVLFPEINAHGIFYNGALGWITVLDFFTKRARPEVFAVPELLVKCQVAMRIGSSIFLRTNATNPLQISFRFSIWLDCTIPPIHFENRRRNSLSLFLSFSHSRIYFRSRRRERDRGKRHAFSSQRHPSIDRCTLFPFVFPSLDTTSLR